MPVDGESMAGLDLRWERAWHARGLERRERSLTRHSVARSTPVLYSWSCGWGHGGRAGVVAVPLGRADCDYLLLPLVFWEPSISALGGVFPRTPAPSAPGLTTRYAVADLLPPDHKLKHDGRRTCCAFTRLGASG